MDSFTAAALTPLHIDGSQGEGGGQILRSALSLSMLYGRPVVVERIRAGRAKPGLMRQHLACVRAAARVCNARVEGDEIGSTRLSFEPGPIAAGDFAFKIGSAGSTLLVLQTVLPALLAAPAPSTLRLEGGTHNPLAPSADFFADCFLPVLRGMGAQIEFELLRHGFFPAGGGDLRVRVVPAALAPLQLSERGDRVGMQAVALLRTLPHHIAERELDVVRRRLGPGAYRVDTLPPHSGPGNALVVTVRHERVAEVALGLGEHGVSAERVADGVCDAVRAYLAHGAPVGEYLADQLLLPMLLAGGGHFVTGRPSRHLETNAAVIESFGRARVRIEPDEGDAQRRYRVTLEPR